MNSLIKIGAGVRFVHIPYEMISMFSAVLAAGEAQRIVPFITGAWGPEYPPGKVHDAGYAIDVRVSDVPNARRYALEIEEYLRAVSPHYKVLYGDTEHWDHIHIGFAWSFARRMP